MSVSSDQHDTPFDVLPGLVWASGPDGVCSYFNKAWLEFRGRTLDQEQGDGWTQGIHSDDLNRRIEIHRAAVDARENFHIEYRLRHNDGSYRWIADEAGPVFGEDGRLTGFVGCCVAIDEAGRRVSAEGSAESTKTANGRKERAKKVETLPMLAGIMAHEFNNLLTPILLNLSIAQSQLSGRQDEMSGEIVRLLQETEAAGLRAKELSTHLLAFGKGGNPVKETVEVRALVEASVARALEGSKVSADFCIEGNIPKIDVDRDQFDEVIDRILTNSLQAMSPGEGVHVDVSYLEQINDPELNRLQGPQVCIRIKDEGPGIRFDLGDRIFDPYFSTKPEAEGLGLTTAQAIVRNHSGEIVIDSETLNGAAFKIYLPVTAAPLEKRSSDEEAPARKSTVRGQGRVLIMDDEDLVRSSLTAMLKAYGYEVETARDGVEALDTYVRARDSDNPIDCTLMDLTIHGGMGGKETIGRLRQIDPEAKAVVCSGHSNDLIMDKFGMYGFRAAIKKPFQPDELNRILQELIHS